MSNSKYDPVADPNVMKLGSESTPYETINTTTGVLEPPEKQQGQLGGIGKEESKSTATQTTPAAEKTKDEAEKPDESHDRARIIQGYGSNETEMRRDLGS